MPSKKATLRAAWNNAGENVVVLHQFQRAKYAPSPSPYPLKLETWLRMNGVDYVSDFESPMSPKGKCPWITINGKDVADSQLAIEYLAEKLGKDMNAHLRPNEQAVARAFRSLIEDNLYFASALDRWVFNLDTKTLREKIMAPFPLPGFLQNFILKRVAGTIKKQCQGQGMGRHSKEEVMKIAAEDIKALSVQLGDKPYMMGDQPTVLDCTVFGFSALAFAWAENEAALEAAAAEAKRVKEEEEKKAKEAEEEKKRAEEEKKKAEEAEKKAKEAEEKKKDEETDKEEEKKDEDKKEEKKEEEEAKEEKKEEVKEEEAKEVKIKKEPKKKAEEEKKPNPMVEEWLKHDNLKAHYERIREKFWSDWADMKYKPEEKPKKEKKEKKEKKKEEEAEKKAEDKEEEKEKKESTEEEKKDEEKPE